MSVIFNRVGAALLGLSAIAVASPASAQELSGANTA